MKAIGEMGQAQLLAHDRLCNEIMAIEGIRFCAVRDFTGQTLAGGQKPGIPRIETDEERTRSATRTGIIAAMIQSMPASFGKVKSMSVDFEELTLLVFPLESDNMLQVTTEPDAVSAKQKIVDILKHSERS